MPGGQAQYIRIPKAGGTLFNISGSVSISQRLKGLPSVSDSSLLLLADILPTGVFAALQTLQHPKISPVITGKAYPFNGLLPEAADDISEAFTTGGSLREEDRNLRIAVVGLGPVGIVS